MKSKKSLVVIGDRVLVDPGGRHDRTKTGLYLPATVQEKDKAQSGYVVATGPGYPVQDPNKVMEEPWAERRGAEFKYVPLQVQAGDYAIFLRDAAVEVEYEGKKYLIVPHSAVLAVVRSDYGV
ncbi:co-chaperone GroES [bacterium]|nr:co-chaperone GroES [bacterium]